MQQKGAKKMDYYKQSLVDSIEMCNLVISNGLILDALLVEKARQEKKRFEFMLMQYNLHKQMQSYRTLICYAK